MMCLLEQQIGCRKAKPEDTKNTNSQSRIPLPNSNFRVAHDRIRYFIVSVRYQF